MNLHYGKGGGRSEGLSCIAVASTVVRYRSIGWSSVVSKCVAKRRALSIQQYGGVHLQRVVCVFGGFCHPQLN